MGMIALMLPGFRTAYAVQAAWKSQQQPSYFVAQVAQPLSSIERLGATLALQVLQHAWPQVEYQDGHVMLGMGRSFGTTSLQTAVRTADDGATTLIILGSPALPPLSY